ncbi:MAG: hypothetical protein WCL50_06220 [Spirochaetota bacterium]
MKNHVIVLALCGLFTLPAPLLALDESLVARIAVAPLVNESDDPSLELVGHAVTDTIGLTLRLMGTWRVEQPEGLEVVGDLESAKAFAASSKIDSLVLGSVNRDDAEALIFTVRLFDRQRGDFKITRSAKADSILDVFDAADSLTKGFLEELSGMHIGFGAVEIANSGERGEYEVRVDGSAAGRNLTAVPKVLNGHHVVTIVQNRLFGELELARLDTTIVEDETATLRFAVPYLTDAERAKIDGLFADAAAGIDGPGNERSYAAMAELATILANTSWSPRLGELRSELAAIRPLVEAMTLRFAVEASPLAPDPTVIDALRDLLVAAKRDAAMKAGASDQIEKIVTETANIEAVLLEYEAAKAAAARDWARVATVYEGMKGILDLTDDRLAGYYLDRMARFNQALDAYLAKAIRPSVLAPWAIGGGLVLAAGGAAILATSFDKSMAQDAAIAYSLYLAATDSSSAEDFRTKVEWYTTEANGLAVGKWVGLVGGPLLSLWGAGEAIRSEPKNTFQRYMGSFFQASIDSRRRFAEGLAKRPGDAVLLTPTMDARLDVNSTKGSPMPVFIDYRSTPEVQVSGGNSWIPGAVTLPGFRPHLLLFLNPWEYPSWGIPSYGMAAEPAWVRADRVEKPEPAAPERERNPFVQVSLAWVWDSGGGNNLGGFTAGTYLRISPTLYAGAEVMDRGVFGYKLSNPFAVLGSVMLGDPGGLRFKAGSGSSADSILVRAGILILNFEASVHTSLPYDRTATNAALGNLNKPLLSGFGVTLGWTFQPSDVARLFQ